MNDALIAHARRRGIAPDWTDISGVRHEVGATTLEALLDALGPRVSNTPNVPNVSKVEVAWDGVLGPA